jgi:hypothetical protein
MAEAQSMGSNHLVKSRMTPSSALGGRPAEDTLICGHPESVRMTAIRTASRMSRDFSSIGWLMSVFILFIMLKKGKICPLYNSSEKELWP